MTNQIAEKAWALIQEVEELGGMAKAIENGLPKLRIEEAAARKQARIDSGTDKIIGVNLFQYDDDKMLDTLEVDNSAVRKSQVKRIKKIKSKRDEKAVQSALRKLATCAKTGKGNLLDKAIQCARLRAT